MNKVLYSTQIKMADMISSDPELLSILERLDVRLGFADADIATVCKQYDLSVNLFLMICNVYSFEGYKPNIALLKNSDISRIVSYLRASHRYYTEKFFPAFHENIHRMLKGCDDIYSRVLNKFYDDYDSEVAKHFAYEEDIVFPYIERLMNKDAICNGVYSIEQFEKNHTNIDEKLNDLKNIVIKYIPEENSDSIRFDVLRNIFQIEKDLMKHTMVENKILIPLVSKFERDD